MCQGWCLLLGTRDPVRRPGLAGTARERAQHDHPAWAGQLLDWPWDSGEGEGGFLLKVIQIKQVSE